MQPKIGIKKFSGTTKNIISHYFRPAAADNKIIESDIENSATSTIETTIEKVIMKDNQIIESNITNEEFPLDFDNLNIV